MDRLQASAVGSPSSSSSSFVRVVGPCATPATAGGTTRILFLESWTGTALQPMQGVMAGRAALLLALAAAMAAAQAPVPGYTPPTTAGLLAALPRTSPLCVVAMP
mgnify:CR=1 FL=1